jgi:hypothetical protein
MKTNWKIYSICNKLSAICMILALLWLTARPAFMYPVKEDLTAKQQSFPLSGTEDETNPFGNSTEEKAPSGNSFSEEYLHDHHTDEYFFLIDLQYHKGENAGTYIAYHGELLVPPPDLA